MAHCCLQGFIKLGEHSTLLILNLYFTLQNSRYTIPFKICTHQKVLLSFDKALGFILSHIYLQYPDVETPIQFQICRLILVQMFVTIATVFYFGCRFALNWLTKIRESTSANSALRLIVPLASQLKLIVGQAPILGRKEQHHSWHYCLYLKHEI